MDWRWKIIVQDPMVINLVTTSILDADDRDFVHIETEYSSEGPYFTLYLPRRQFKSHGIVLAFQPIVTEASMRSSISKCLEVQDRFAIQAHLVLLCTTVSLSVKSSLSPTLHNPCWQTLNHTLWAKECLIIASDSAGGSPDGIEEHRDPLVVLATYISADRDRIRKLRNICDPTIQRLHMCNQ
ncbi:hypothetical protein BJV82DRAFT_598085 [Fennellomyces sp. T-0311]|nr:hypothetical protein BJV82DRAFT_598085 [Fennellomyces sp. T-0311]